MIYNGTIAEFNPTQIPIITLDKHKTYRLEIIPNNAPMIPIISVMISDDFRLNLASIGPALNAPMAPPMGSNA